MRCLAIADAAKTMGQQSIFLTAENEFETIITAHGHKNQILFSNFENMSADLMDVKEAINVHNPKIVVVDSYYVTVSYLHLLKEACKSASAVLFILMMFYPFLIRVMCFLIIIFMDQIRSLPIVIAIQRREKHFRDYCLEQLMPR